MYASSNGDVPKHDRSEYESMSFSHHKNLLIQGYFQIGVVLQIANFALVAYLALAKIADLNFLWVLMIAPLVGMVFYVAGYYYYRSGLMGQDAKWATDANPQMVKLFKELEEIKRYAKSQSEHISK